MSLRAKAGFATPRRDSRANRTALITGASSGIGAAPASRFARGGFNLVLVARSADKPKTLAASLSARHGVRTWVAPADLARAGAAKKLAASMKRARRPIDVLVNDAGVLEHGPFLRMPAARHQRLIDVNVAAVTAMLAHTCSRRRGGAARRRRSCPVS
jgi:short-subunit dehydrogenase